MFCYRRVALDGARFSHYRAIFISLLILLFNVYPWFHQFIAFSHVPVPRVLSSSHFSSLLSHPSLSPLFSLAIPHAEVYPSSSCVNNTCPRRLQMCRGSKILGLGCFSVCSPPGSLTLTVSGWEEYWVNAQHTHRDTVVGTSPEYKQKHTHVQYVEFV